MGKGNIYKMVLLRRVRKQLLSQYIDDTTFNLVGNEDNVDKIMVWPKREGYHKTTRHSMDNHKISNPWHLQIGS